MQALTQPQKCGDGEDRQPGSRVLPRLFVRSNSVGCAFFFEPTHMNSQTIASLVIRMSFCDLQPRALYPYQEPKATIGEQIFVHNHGHTLQLLHHPLFTHFCQCV